MLKVQLNWQSLTFKVLLVTSLIVLVAMWVFSYILFML